MRLAIAAAAVIAVALVGLFWLRPLIFHGPEVQYRTVPVGYADITAAVEETGTINPVNQVLVGSEASGMIKTLNADFNSVVKKGQVLATLDSTTLQAAVDSATANLALARANLNSARVNVDKMKDQLDLANMTLQREEPLVKQGLAAQSQLDADTTAAETAKQDYLSAQSAVQVAQAQVSVIEGALEQARYNLSRTVIKSPIDGIVMARNVSVGQTVAASLQTPTLFILATNLTDMQVDTSVDEADVGSVHKGQPASITVTAFPNVTFSGTVEQVRVNPTTVQNVVTYDAVIAVHDTSGRLLPGMTAQVKVEVGKQAHVLSIPIAAVLYRPLPARASGGSGGGGFGGAAAAGFIQSGTPAGPPVAGAPGSRVTVWTLREGRPVPVQVVIGLSDGKNIEITSGSLHEGDQLIIAQRSGGDGGNQRGGQGSSGGAAPSAGGGGGPSGGGSSAAHSDGAQRQARP